MKYLSSLLVLFLVSCKCAITASAVTQRTPDVLSKPTHTVMAEPTVVELPRETEIKTESVVEAELVRDTEVSYKLEATQVVEPGKVVLPAHTEILLPKDVYLSVMKAAPINLETGTGVLLPTGTQITTSKVNWYAILFYCLLFLLASAWFIKSRQNDKNEDGFEDVPKVKKSVKK